MMQRSNLQLYFFLGIFAVVAVVTGFIFLPYVSLLTLSAVIAVIFNPVKLHVQTVVKNKTLAAAITLLCIILLVCVPLSFFGTILFQQVHFLYTAWSSGNSDVIHTIEALLQRVFPSFSIQLQDYIQQALGIVAGSLGTVFAGTATTIFSIVLGLIGVFFMLRDGEIFVQHITAMSPLDDKYDREVFAKLKIAIATLVKGTLLVALIQGIVAGIGFTLFGIPNAALWGGVAMFAALIPGVGTSLVLVPAIIYSFFTGTLFDSVALTAWSVIAVGCIDNVLAPKLMSRAVSVHPFLILLSVFGGIGFFGPTGFLLGPLTLSLLFALGDIYREMMVRT